MLDVGHVMPLALAAVFIGALIRVFGVILLPAKADILLSVSGVLWVVAFSVFVIRYFPVLTQARIDGRPG
jgi:uncharacterized protein involved in response to NO